MAKRGINLLLGHLKGTSDSLDTAMASEDVQALIVASDPLVTVATILVRMLRDVTDETVESTLASLRKYTDLDIVPVGQLEQVETLITRIISEGFSALLPVSAAQVALIAHDIGIGAATEISRIDGRHVNKVVADLHVQLKKQGDAVQITDRAGARAASDKYAGDLEMQKARQLAAYTMVDYWHRAAVALHKASQNDELAEGCRDSLEALSLVAVTVNALTGGVYQLAGYGNTYPAWTLIRQLVETEFILWRFMNDIAQMPVWLHSTPEERRQNWKPGKIYRHDDNDYRQKDYWYHCELGGHPTPDGARVIVGAPGTPVSLASLFSEDIAHSWEGWRHLAEAAKLVDGQCGTNIWNELVVIDAEFGSTISQWCSVDMYRRTTAFYSDPLD